MSDLREIRKLFDHSKNFCKKRTVRKKDVLIQQGEVSNSIYFIQSGILRMWHNANGDDITLQFFEANQVLASCESFYLQKPSKFTLEVIEKGEILEISKIKLNQILEYEPEIKEILVKYIYERFIEYMNLFLSRIKNTPEQRYIELIENYPDMVEKIPHHYLASYLGITPVSFSRIRARIKNKD